jgi:hypothetical protein
MTNNNNNMTNVKEMTEKMNEIKKRWMDMPSERYCENFMRECIRHAHGNEEFCRGSFKGEYCDTTNHPNRNDGYVLSFAPQDIGDLLRIIDGLLESKPESELSELSFHPSESEDDEVGVKDQKVKVKDQKAHDSNTFICATCKSETRANIRICDDCKLTLCQYNQVPYN